MKHREPLVSVVLPVCNASSFLRASLESLVSQTYKRFEIIAIDDFSKDNSFDILSFYRKKDKRFKIFRNKKRYGMALTLNRAMKRAKGTYIAFANAAGSNSPHRIQAQVSFLLSHPKTAAVGTQCILLDENNKKIGKTEFPEESEHISKGLIPSLSLLPETIMVNRLTLPKDILYFRAKPYPLIFTDVFMKFLSYAEIANLPKILYYYRKTQDTLPKALTFHSLTYGIKVWLNSFVEDQYRPSFKSLFVTFNR